MPHLRDQENPTLTPRRSPRFTSPAAIDTPANKKQIEEFPKSSRKSTTRPRKLPRSSSGKVNSERRVTSSFTPGSIVPENGHLEHITPKMVCSSSVSEEKGKTHYLFVEMPLQNMENSTQIEEFTKSSRKSSSRPRKSPRSSSGTVNTERRVTRGFTPGSVVLDNGNLEDIPNKMVCPSSVSEDRSETRHLFVEMPFRNLENSTPFLRRSPRFTDAAATEIPADSKHVVDVSKSSGKSSPKSQRCSRLKSKVNIERRVTRNSPGSIVLACAAVEQRRGSNGSKIVKRAQETSKAEKPVPSSEVVGCGENDNVTRKRIVKRAQGTSKTKKAVPSSEVVGCGEDDNVTGKRIVKRAQETSITEKTVPSSKVMGCGEDDNVAGKRIIKHAQETSITEKPVPSSDIVGCGENNNVTGKKQGQGCLKRKRNQAMEESSSSSVANGWSNEQELALQSAYFAAKATPHFWKRVAKLVPGKSAKECFDKIHSDFLTPPQHQPRSRTKTVSSFSPCAAKLLLSTGKNTNKRKPRNTLSQKKKNVRLLLQKQYDIDGRDNEADFFNVFESTTSDQAAKPFPENTKYFTPMLNKKESLLKRCLERSSSAHKKQLSRFSGSTLISPPVLKPIKNKVLHERYIDKLHRREAKRMAAISRTAKGNQSKNDTSKDESVRKKDVIKAAKNALLSEAKDAIDQFKNLQICGMDSFCGDDGDDDDENYNSDDDPDDA